MDGGQIPSTAMVSFAATRDAERRVAGISVVGRIVRDLVETGCSAVWLTLPDGETLGAAAMADVRRLAEGTDVHLNRPPSGVDIVEVSPTRLAVSGTDLVAPGATAAILRQTGKAGDGPISRWLNRPVSRRLSAVLLLVPGFRPLHATLGTVMLALAMFAALVAGGHVGLVAGGLLFQAASIFDGVDGEVARATFRTSKLGATLDSLVDAGTNALFIVGVTANLAQAGNERAFALGAWGLALFVVGQAVIGWRTSRMNAPVGFDLLKHHYRERASGWAAAWLMRFLTVVSSRDFFALLFAVLILADAPMAVLYIFSAAATIWMAFLIGSLFARHDRALVSEGR
jgi:CDP-L-myo-inositol myo-inositolphosphotransferase